MPLTDSVTITALRHHLVSKNFLKSQAWHTTTQYPSPPPALVVSQHPNSFAQRESPQHEFAGFDASRTIQPLTSGLPSARVTGVLSPDRRADIRFTPQPAEPPAVRTPSRVSRAKRPLQNNEMQLKEISLPASLGDTNGIACGTRFRKIPIASNSTMRCPEKSLLEKRDYLRV